MLEIKNVSKTFAKDTVNEHKALNNINLTLNDGEFVTIVGSNGAGKSTLFNMICGTFEQDSGSIILDGKDISFMPEHKRARLVGRVFQDPMKGTAPNMTIEENLALAYSRAGSSFFSQAIGKKKREYFQEHLARFDMGLEDRMKTKIGLLSGGQRQVVTLLMCTIVTPKLLLLDEHTAALDPVTADKVMKITASDIEGSVQQAKELASAGCQVIRFAIPNEEALNLIEPIKNAVDVPLVADIHFDYKLALGAAERGIDKIRINPGNIGDDSRVKAVADACRQKNIPIRIGVNSGSLEKHILAKYGSPTPEAMVESALYHANLLEKFDFDDIIISIKSSNVETMINAYELAAQKCDYPLHLGVTEAGTERMGIIKSAVGIGSLLTHGIGDTIRVSLTDSPVKEVFAAFDILKAIGLKNDSPYLISCPTCGRTKIDLVGLAKQVEEKLKDCKKPIKVAVMGCIVNGPGEAKEADIGIAGGDGCGLIFKKGEILRKVDEKDLLDELMKEIDKL